MFEIGERSHGPFDGDVWMVAAKGRAERFKGSGRPAMAPGESLQVLIGHMPTFSLDFSVS